ncbi:MAG: methyltransferase family protein [Desulfomonilaceae bacterium]
MHYLTRDLLLMVITQALGTLSLLAMFVFIFKGSLDLVGLNMDESGALTLDSLLSIAFFVQHSGMVRKSFKRWSTQLIAEKYGGIVFSLASSFLLIATVALWQKSGVTVVSAHGGARWLLRLIFGLSFLGFLWGASSIGSLDTFGLEQLRKSIQGRTIKPPRLVIRGPYRWIRHPLYFFCIVMIWSCPDVTIDRLLFNVLWTVWIIVGIFLEERDLVSQFGDCYLRYQRDVPMLIPTRLSPQRNGIDGRPR